MSPPLKTIVIASSAFPFINGETFLENEVLFLSKHFEKIYIITSLKETKKRKFSINNPERDITPNVKAIAHIFNITLIEKILAFRFLFSLKVLKELLSIATKYKKNKIAIIEKILGNLIEANKFNSFLNSVITAYNIDKKNTIFYSYWTDYKALALAINKHKKTDITNICRGHRWDVYFYSNPLNYLPFRKFIYNNTSHVYFISKDGYNYVKQRFKTSNNMSVSYLGTYKKEENLFSKLPTTNQLHIVSCSNIIQVKRVDLIAKVIFSLPLDVPIRWTHFGTGSQLTTIQQIIKDLQASRTNIVVDIKGQVNNSDVLNFYANHEIDLFINLSVSEGIPVSIMEAISFKIPVIATNVGGTSEIVVNKLNGFLVDINSSIQDIAKVIIDYYHLTPEQKIRLRDNAFEYWQNNFNANTNYLNFVKSLNSLA